MVREVSGDGLESKPDASHCMGVGVSCLIINLRVMGQGGRGQRAGDISWGQRRAENGDGHMYFINGRGVSGNQPVEAGLDAGMGETSWAKAGATNEVPGGSGARVRQGSLGARPPAQKSHEQICKFFVLCSLVQNAGHLFG